MGTHTPDWSPVRIYQDTNNNKYRATIWERGGRHCLNVNIPDEVDVANLNLARVAPHLLAACQFVLQEIEWGHDMAASEAILRQAIARVND